MKLVNLVTTTLSLLAASQPLASPESKSSDVWIGLDLNQCLTNASTIPPQSTSLPRVHPRIAKSVPARTFAQVHLAPNTCSLAAQQDTARAVIEAYNAWDIDDILAYRSPDCKHRVIPASMDRAAKSNDEYRAYLSMIMPLYSNFTVRAPRPRRV
jgi:hypothetical protein